MTNPTWNLRISNQNLQSEITELGTSLIIAQIAVGEDAHN